MIFRPEQIIADIAVSGSPDPEAFCLLCSGRDVFLVKHGEQNTLPFISQVQDLIGNSTLYCAGYLDDIPCYGVLLKEKPSTIPEWLFIKPGRSLLAEGKPELWTAFSRVREMAGWIMQHRYCGGCRTQLAYSDKDLALFCPDCGMRYYPQIAPAVIVAVTRNNGNEILLAHNRNFEADIYGLIAGFVETGETVEQAVAREIMEETSVSVSDIKYLASQTWPFPNSLMLAFSAEYESGIAAPDGEELVQLGWFTKENLPKLPPEGSIARYVIEQYFIKSGQAKY